MIPSVNVRSPDGSGIRVLGEARRRLMNHNGLFSHGRLSSLDDISLRFPCPGQHCSRLTYTAQRLQGEIDQAASKLRSSKFVRQERLKKANWKNVGSRCRDWKIRIGHSRRDAFSSLSSQSMKKSPAKRAFVTERETSATWNEF